MNQAYLDFIKYAINLQCPLPKNSMNIDWDDFLKFCNRQGIIGLIFDALERSNLKIPQRTLFEWISYSESIKQQNIVTNLRVCEINRFFKHKGYRSVILKGQVNGLMYPKPELRTPGDIDIWVDGNRKELIKLILSVTPESHYDVYHMKFPMYKDVMVEVHYLPAVMLNKILNRRLQNYIRELKETQFANQIILDGQEISCLTDGFNLVYQMLHMYGHFFESRNSFKQLIDYYYLLIHTNFDTSAREAVQLLSDLHLTKYATGIMWIMNQIFGLDRSKLILDPDEKIGKLIIENTTVHGCFSKNKFYQLIEQLFGNLKVFWHFPSTVIYSPLHLIWHQWWKFKTRLSL